METLVRTESLTKHYGIRHIVRAVEDVSLHIERGRSLALIGESGSGKTTFARLISGLEKPTGGSIELFGKSMDGMSEKELRPMRRDLQIVFQSSGGVFDPGYTIGESIREVLANYEKLSASEYEERTIESLRRVGLDPSLRLRYVSQLSGGQCQRANIARALVLAPKLVICDEPVSSLDYSIRKQILELLREIQDRYGVTYLLITHDLSNVPYVCQAVAIMYQGHVVEYLDSTERIGERVTHPYSRLLYRSIPAADPRQRTIAEAGDTAADDMRQVETGCPFRLRCPHARDICAREKPASVMTEPGHMVACHRA